MLSTKSLPIAAAVILALAAINSASGQTTYYWNQNGVAAGWGTSGTWDSSVSAVFTAAPENPTGAAVAATTGTGDTLNFGSATTGFAGGTITVSGNQSIGTIITGSANTTAGILISGGTLNFAAAGTVANNSPQNLTLGSGIALAGNALTFNGAGTTTVQTTGISNGSVIKSGAGTLNLNVNSAFAGGLTIRAGTVATATATSQGAGSVTIGDSANTGANATWFSSSANNNYTSAISTTGNGTNSIIVAGFNPTYSGPITLGSNLSVISSNNGGSTISSTGGVSGTGNLTIQSNAANVASSAITFSGTTLNFNGVQLALLGCLAA